MDEPLIEVELRSGAEEFQPGVLVEAAAGDEIYLGVVVERDQQNRIRLEVEHYLNRQTSAALQLAWKKSTQSVA